MKATRTLLLLVVLAGLPALAAFGARSFFSPDEANYAQVAREMLETRDFVVPHRDGAVWLNKPPLAFWLLSGSFALLGWGLAAAIALNALLTLATAALVARQAGGLGSPAGRMSGVVYLTAFLPVIVAQSGMTDAALVLCTTAAVVLYLARGRTAALLAGLAFGLAMLAKGPVAPLVVLPAIAAAELARPARRHLRRAFAVVLAGAAVVVPWIAALAFRGLLPQLAAQFLEREVLSRTVDAWNIAAPFWFYLPVLWAMAFPWGTHLLRAPWGLPRAEGSRWWRDPIAAAEVAAVVVPLIAFSVARNKLPHYLLPIMPWLACWLGRAMANEGHEAGDRARRPVAVAALAIGPAATVVLAWWARRLAPPRVLPDWWLAFGVGLAVVLAALAILELLERRRLAWGGLAAVGIVTVIVLDLGLFPHLERQRVDRPVAEAAAACLPPGGIAIAHARWRTAYLAYGPRGWGRTATRAELAAALARAREAGRPSLVVTAGDAEGDVRAVALQQEATAIEVFRLVGLAEERFRIDEVVGFRFVDGRSHSRWFYDGDRALPGDSGLWGTEGHRYVASYRWTKELDAKLPVAIEASGPTTLRLRARGLALHGRQQTLALTLGGCDLGTITLDERYRVFALPVPVACLGPPSMLDLRCDHLVRPINDVPGSRDTRRLGAALDWIALDPAGPVTRLVGGRDDVRRGRSDEVMK